MIQTFASYTARLGELIAQTTLLEDATFNRLALDLFAVQFDHNAPYRRFCESRQITPASIGNWRSIPAVPTVAFKELELTSLPDGERTTVFHSSGTTLQRPSRHFHNPESLAVYDDSLLSWFRCHLLPEMGASLAPQHSDFAIVSLTPPAHEAPHSSLVHMCEVVVRVFGSRASSFAGNVGAERAWTLEVEPLVDRLRRLQGPVVLLGTAFNFVELLDRLVAASVWLRLPEGSRAMETGGYKGRSRTIPRAELHAMISSRLGIALDHVVSEYGMSELSSQAYDTCVPLPHQLGSTERVFGFPPWARVQIISPETGCEVAEGDCGLVRVFDLANVRSVLAVQTEDLAIRRGDGFALVGRAPVAEPRGCSLMTA